MSKLLSGAVALVAALALAPAAFGANCTDCDPGGGGGGTTNKAPTAAFSYAPQNPFTLANVTFTNSSSDSDGSIASSAWTFGDGGTSTASSPTHQYASSGSYTVTLTVTDNLGKTASVQQTVTVTNRAPTAQFLSPDVIQVGENLAPTNKSSDLDGQVVAYEWNFGDGTTSTAALPAKVYGAPGTYTVALKATDDKGSYSTFSKEVRVNAAPVAQIVSSTEGLKAGFGANAADADGEIVSYAWDFGDGSTSNAANPSHAYAAAGTYTVTLVVTDNDGASTQVQAPVTVSLPNTGGGDGGSNGDGSSNGGGSGSGGGAVDNGGGPTQGGSTQNGGGPEQNGGGGVVPGAKDTKAPALVVPAKLKVKRSVGRLVYTVSLDEAGTVIAKLKGKVAGTAKVKITKAGKAKIVIKLSSKAKKALKAAKSVKLTLITTATDAAGNKTTKVTKVTLA